MNACKGQFAFGTSYTTLLTVKQIVALFQLIHSLLCGIQSGMFCEPIRWTALNPTGEHIQNAAASIGS